MKRACNANVLSIFHSTARDPSCIELEINLLATRAWHRAVTKTMDTLRELERLDLVGKVTSEVSNHTGIADKKIAEFLIHKYKSAKSFEQFKSRFRHSDLRGYI